MPDLHTGYVVAVYEPAPHVTRLEQKKINTSRGHGGKLVLLSEKNITIQSVCNIEEF